MVNYPNAKINLGLRVLRRRADGFHDIETVMYPVHSLCDTLEVLKKCESRITQEPWYSNYHGKLIDTGPEPKMIEKLAFLQSGVPDDLMPEDNLCVKAFRMYCEAIGVQAEYHIQLIKGIPAGAGLGGGSSDAAFVLKMMNELNGRKLSSDDLVEMAAGLGSDCPFFILNEPVVARGRGEIMSPVVMHLEGMHLVILDPGIHVDTASAYSSIALVDHSENLPSDIVGRPVNEWKGLLVNDFEHVVFNEHPVLGELKNALYSDGAEYASMSGSGSSLFGIFSNEPQLSEMVQNVVIHKSVMN